jgi:hypothetical protein|tara:strand:+ start:4499 stop:5158 length:660 start_codon:yes stop_codon:yes gene_type:complete
MIRIGIDFSLNSPGACVETNDGQYHFITFFNYGNRIWDEEGRKIPKAFSVHKELMDSNALLGFPYNRQVTSKEFLPRERQKLEDAGNISSLMVGIFSTLFEGDKVAVGLEGFSYGSKGNSFIDIIQYNTFLRKALIDKYSIENLSVYQPSHVKKLAGKGNANKHYMAEAFQNDVLNDKSLRNTKLWKWCQGKDFSTKIPKPIDDIVDAYFILKALKASN